MEITYTNNRIQQGSFPEKQLNELKGITCIKTGSKGFTDSWKIEIDMSVENNTDNNTPENIAFSIGMLVHSYMILNH